MAPSRRNSSGTPTPTSQRTISSFFSSQLKQTPSPSQDNSKPCLHVGPPSPPPEGSSLVGRKLKVYWPLDKAWYNGVVHSWCNESGKHKILYEDGEEESVVLASEKIQWIDQSDCIVGKKSFRRLRKSGDSTALDDSGVLDNSGNLESSTKGKKKTANEAKELELSEDHEDGGNESESDGDWGRGPHDALQNMEEDELEVDAKKKKRKQLTEKVLIKRQKVLKTKTEIQGAVDFMKNMAEAHAVAVSPGIKEQDKLQGRGSFGNGGEGEIQIVLSGEIAERFGSRSAEKFKFLYKSRRDSAGRGPSDPNFDSRTLFLPSEFLKGLTGGQRQWWEFKSKHMDKVLFFKMGKFYELFEMDAHIGAKELDLQYMKGEQPHCGFPEKNYAENAERLTRKGYRVLVVEQTETPEQLEQRKRETGAKDKVVKREICAVLTKGTILDGDMVANNSDPAYFLSITETCGRTPDENCVLGVCASDTSRGLFLLDEFPDDSSRTRLRSILSELLPVEIVKPKENLSETTERVLRDYSRMPLINTLIPSLEFWDAERSASEIVKFYSFHPCTISGQHSEGIPYLLHRLMNCSIGKVALSAFGGCMFYLRQAMLDISLLPSGRFEILPGSNMSHDLANNCPEDERSFVKEGSNYKDVFELNMAIDSSALENLEILENNSNGGTSGTLFGLLDHCVTPFGRRLLKQWLVRPLLDVDSILERQWCLSDLKEVAASAVTSFRRHLIGIPDMERLLARLCASCGGSGRYSQRVVLYEDAAKQLLKEFTKALRGFQAVIAAVSSFETCMDLLASGYLLSLVSTGKAFPVISPIVSHFEAAFDWIEAEKTGRILPRPGVDTNFDSAVQAVSAIEARFEEHLNKQRQKFGNSPEIIYTTVGKESYLLEVPDHLLSKVPSDYELRSSRKGYRRFWTPQIKELLQELSLKQEEKEVVLKGILQELLKQFCQSHNELLNAVKTIAELDALMSLSIASTYMEGNVCQPSFSRETSFLKAKALRHPTIQANVNCGGSFVPNNVSLGGDSAPFMLLTGPNMGGKSTFLRQVCLAVILAQIGADVPAESFELSPVDKLFVRMGAKDHIMAAQSTFFVELSETANMLSRATKNSLVALDELGRGTSTSDGQAIAHAVLQHLAHSVGCRGLFSSHYHRLADDHANDPCVSLNHMMCKVGEGADGLEEVTFLYKLQAGQCPKSYGVNVARIAGMPSIVLHRANEISAQFEKDHSVCLPSDAQSLVEELLQTRSTESQMRELILLWKKTCHVCMKSINVPRDKA